MNYMDFVREKTRLRRLSASQGWKENCGSFIHSNRSYSSDGKVFLIDGNDESFSVKGFHDVWTESTSILNSTKHSSHAFTILLAFAAPLIPFSGIGGIVVSPYGYNRDLLIRWMLSVWGDPSMMKSPAGEETQARLRRYRRHGSIPLLIDNDDIPMADMTRLSNEFGRGTAKAYLHHGDAVTAQIYWGTILVLPMLRSLSKRILLEGLPKNFNPIFDYEIPKNEEMGSKIYDIEDIITANTGVVGALYAKYIAMHSDGIRQLIATEERRLTESAKIGAEFRNFMALLACVSVGGGIASKLDLIKFDIKPAVEFGRQKARQIHRNIMKKKV
jgi:hypothetical protein